jgi:hypothetical protein
MKIGKLLITVALAILTSSLVAQAAPVDSVASGRAAALAKVDAFLGDKVVADQLTALGLSAEQARSRLAQLSDAQVEQLAAQVDLIQTGGSIQSSGDPWPLLCVFKTIGTLFGNVFRLLFCWGPMK